jgi:hypothetical protein
MCVQACVCMLTMSWSTCYHPSPFTPARVALHSSLLPPCPNTPPPTPQFIKKASSLMGAAKDEVLELQYKVRGGRIRVWGPGFRATPGFGLCDEVGRQR